MIIYNDHITDDYHHYLASLAMFRFVCTTTEEVDQFTTSTVKRRISLTNEYYKSVKLTLHIQYQVETILNTVTYNSKLLFYYTPLGI